MELRAVLYWVMSVGAFILCLLYPIKSNTNDVNTPALNLASYLKVEPRYIYYADNRFHARLIGPLKIVLKTADIAVDFTQFNTLIINDFQFELDTTFSLNWLVDNQPHQVLINKTNESITAFDFKTNDHNKISDVHILIEPNTELNNQSILNQEASFQSLSFDVIENQSVWSSNISEWTDFTPIKFNSINGYTNSKDLHFKQMIIRLSAWLLFSVVVYLVIKISGLHLVITLMLAWAITAFFFINNHSKQNQQLHMAFAAEGRHLNPLDQSALEVAQSIQNNLKQNPAYDASQKFVLLGQNDFFNLRLVYYLFEYNIGLSSNFEDLFKEHNQFAFILLNQAYVYCNNTDQFDWLDNQVEFIIKNDQYCIVKKK